MESELNNKRDALLELIGGLPSCGVAYSGGVDSAVVAMAAYQSLGDQATAVTGISPSLGAAELEEAKAIAQLIGIRHELIETREFDRPEYVRNAGDRCFHCKSELYGLTSGMASRFGFAVILNGANVDDLSDYRPGLQAAADFSVRSPLVECEITKHEVRQLARAWELPVWDKPANPCLSSRVAYGETVTPERLQMIDAAEGWLRERGFAEVRVRYHRGDVARIEVPAADVQQLATLPLREQLVRHLSALGFRFISLDLEGFRSGSLNQLVQLSSSGQAGQRAQP